MKESPNMRISKGDITIEVEKGDDPHQAVELLRALDCDPKTGPDSSLLTPKQRAVYEPLLHHPEGSHYSVIAGPLGLAPNIVNSRLNDLVKAYPHLVERVGAGKFKAVSE